MKKFLFSVADAYFYKSNSQDLIFKSTTLVDSSIEATIQNEDARAGKGNSLQFIYYHSAELNVNLTEQQFNMEMLAPSIGANLMVGDIFQVTEEVTLGVGGSGTVTQGLPINSKYVTNSVVTGTLETVGVDTERESIEFTGSDFTYASGVENQIVCVTYNILDPTAITIEVNANMIPSVGRLVLKAQLGSSESGVADESSSVIGEVEIEIPSLQLNPSGIGMQMSSSGISQSELAGRALAFQTSGGCTTSAVYASIKERIYGSEKYSNAKALVCVNSDIEMTLADAKTENVDLLVIPTMGTPFRPDVADVTYVTDDAAVATVSATGVITAVGAGTATITATLARTAPMEALVATCQVTVV